MATRLVDGAAASIERWLSGLSGPEIREPPYYPGQEDGQPSPSGVAPKERDTPQQGQYDEDFDYYWGDFRIPLWIALIWRVPWRQRLDIFVIGFMIGLIVAGIAVVWGLVLTQY